MYRPVLQVNQAAVELSVLILTPLKSTVCHFLKVRGTAHLSVPKIVLERKTVRGKERSLLNPAVELLRTGKVLSGLLKGSGIELPVRKVIVSRTSYIDYPEPPYGIGICDKRHWKEWLEKQQKLRPD